MPPETSPVPDRSEGTTSQFALLLLCFFLSGLAALIYQTAWTRQFAFVFGTSELAVASVLAAYMGGLALGAAVIGRLAPRVTRPILVYGLLELAIAFAALAVPFGVQLATKLYVAIFGAQGAPADEGGLLSALFYLACSFVILLVPTSLMGATLPLLARHAVRREDQIGRRIARLYAMNTAGAVAGTALTGFVLLPSLGLAWTVWIAVGANALVFAAAAALARFATPVARSAASQSAPDPRSPNRWILPLILVSGAVSFTYEVFWTRLLGHVLGGSVYAFATMLATFLAGIALGSALASGRLAANRRIAATSFAWAQVGTAFLSLAAYIAVDATPGWVEATRAVGDARLLLDAGIAAAILLPGALCIGATFPLAVRVLARSQTEAGGASARVYAWNTVGSIIGAVGAGFFLIPAVGFGWTLTIAVATNSGLAIATALRCRPQPRAALAAAAAALLVLAIIQPEPPWQLLRTGAIRSRVRDGEIVYFGVGRGATVMLQTAPGGWQLSSNGLAEAVINEKGVRAAHYVMVRWLSNLPLWGRPEAKSILIVGFGGGLVVEAVPPAFERVEVVEIETEILTANAEIATRRSRDPLSDPRVEVIVNDARGALLLTEERYDAIVSQPSHPWTASASHLYTREFFQLAKDHLHDDGVFVQWMGLGFVDEPLLRSLVATLRDVFPHVRMYRPSTGGFLFSASAAPFKPEQVTAALLAESPISAEIGIHSGMDVAAHLVLDDEGATRFAEGAAVSTDDRNLLQMRSPEIVRSGRRFDPVPVLSEYDPLVGKELPWSRSYLVRRMFATGLVQRAKRLASAATDPVESHVGAALVSRREGDSRAMRQHFLRALAVDPENDEAQIGLLNWLRGTRRPTAELATALGSPPTPTAKLLIDGWSLADAEDWAALRELDERLAGVAPAHPAFAAATRLRVRWRIDTGGASEAAEALALIDSVLPTGGVLYDFVLRAHAASLAGYPAGATSSLIELARKADRRPASARALKAGLIVLRELPADSLSDERRQRLRARLLARIPTR